MHAVPLQKEDSDVKLSITRLLLKIGTQEGVRRYLKRKSCQISLLKFVVSMTDYVSACEL